MAPGESTKSTSAWICWLALILLGGLGSVAWLHAWLHAWAIQARWSSGLDWLFFAAVIAVGEIPLIVLALTHFLLRAWRVPGGQLLAHDWMDVFAWVIGALLIGGPFVTLDVLRDGPVAPVIGLFVAIGFGVFLQWLYFGRMRERKAIEDSFLENDRRQKRNAAENEQRNRPVIVRQARQEIDLYFLERQSLFVTRNRRQRYDELMQTHFTEAIHSSDIAAKKQWMLAVIDYWVLFAEVDRLYDQYSPVIAHVFSREKYEEHLVTFVKQKQLGESSAALGTLRETLSRLHERMLADGHGAVSTDVQHGPIADDTAFAAQSQVDIDAIRRNRREQILRDHERWQNEQEANARASFAAGGIRQEDIEKQIDDLRKKFFAPRLAERVANLERELAAEFGT